MAISARDLTQILAPPGACRIRLGLVVASTHIMQHSLVILRVGAHPPESVAVRDHDRVAITVQDQLASLYWQLGPRKSRVKPVVLRQPSKDVLVMVRHPWPRPGRNGSLKQAQTGIGDDQFRVDLECRAQTRTCRASTPGPIEGELTRL